MKVVQIRIEADASEDDGFKLDAEVNQLSREDVTDIEHKICEDVEDILDEYFKEMARQMKGKDPESAFKRIKITKPEKDDDGE